MIFKVFYDIHKSSLNKKNDEEEETSEMLGSGLNHTTTWLKKMYKTIKTDAKQNVKIISLFK